MGINPVTLKPFAVAVVHVVQNVYGCEANGPADTYQLLMTNHDAIIHRSPAATALGVFHRTVINVNRSMVVPPKVGKAYRKIMGPPLNGNPKLIDQYFQAVGDSLIQAGLVTLKADQVGEPVKIDGLGRTYYDYSNEELARHFRACWLACQSGHHKKARTEKFIIKLERYGPKLADIFREKRSLSEFERNVFLMLKSFDRRGGLVMTDFYREIIERILSIGVERALKGYTYRGRRASWLNPAHDPEALCKD